MYIWFYVPHVLLVPPQAASLQFGQGCWAEGMASCPNERTNGAKNAIKWHKKSAPKKCRCLLLVDGEKDRKLKLYPLYPNVYPMYYR